MCQTVQGRSELKPETKMSRFCLKQDILQSKQALRSPEIHPETAARVARTARMTGHMCPGYRQENMKSQHQDWRVIFPMSLCATRCYTLSVISYPESKAQYFVVPALELYRPKPCSPELA